MKLSFDEIRRKIYDVLNPKGSTLDQHKYVEELYEDEVIYNDGTECKKAPYSIKEGEVTMGTAIKVERQVKYVPAFSLEATFTEFSESGTDGAVTRRGKLFEAGDFPDKNVAFDEEDLKYAVQTFAPVPNDLEHANTIFDGKLGQLKKIWKSGTELHGEVEVPTWLDKVIGKAPIKVSLAFDKTKKIIGNALVLQPRISDAAIMSAFTSYQSADKSGDLPTGKTMTIKELITKFGMDQVAKLDVPETLAESLEEVPNTDATKTPEEGDASQEPKEEPKEKPVDQFSKRLASMEAQLLGERALSFADEIIRNRKAVPAQRDQVAAMFRTAVKSDAGNTGSVFNETTHQIVEGVAVAELKAYFSQAPTHAFTGEAFESDTAILLFGTKSDKGMDDEKKAKYLGMTTLGKKAQELSKK